MAEININKITRLERSTIADLLRRSEKEGFRHLTRLIGEYEAGVNLFDKPGEALYGAFAPQLVGVCGLNHDPYSQGPGVGRVRRLYVSPDYRRHGLGRQLLAAIIEDARPYYHTLVLKTDNPMADQFYRSLGFQAATSFPNSTHYLALSDRLY